MSVTWEADNIRLANSQIELVAAAQFGPRITSFSEPGGDNVLAELGDAGISLPDGRTYLLRGGHRLWAAPEVPEITYEPDNGPIGTNTIPNGLRLNQPASSDIGIEKDVQIVLHDNTVALTHTLVNRGTRTIEVAAWAITQLVVGGTAIVPLRKDPVDPHGYQPNASIAVWPYAGVDDSPFVMHDRLLLVDTNRSSPTKFGTSLDRGWLAYLHRGLVFVKRAEHIDAGAYGDLDASGQCYCNADFVELETLGQVSALEPGASTTHVESWELHRIDPMTPPQDVPSLLELDGGL